ncbi:ATP-binding protein [Algoriphagus sp. H41]|uniref:ATP-binding protein n=1 Tax=Algoriphagus oliviformis TaxID=2811231 RepID=A0ABS3BXR5_9BACT|nr:AAA family ATPase [Algoriphagus oliviformis]MBN7809616.1 ATP-binding protein [Algoriphagus oliviformis]
MEKLLLNSQAKIQRVPVAFRRFLLQKIDWGQRLIAINGARGSGKTTLLLQYAKTQLVADGTSLYISLDDLYFSEHSMRDLAEEFYLGGGKVLLLDEIHKYPNWSRELKLIYDDFPDLRVVFTSSSILEIYKGESDLSRRAVSYLLPELSFREFVELETGSLLPVLTLEEILKGHVEIASDLLGLIQPVALFHQYVKWGSYPFFKEGKEAYLEKLRKTVQLILEVDLMAVENMDYEMIFKLKKLIRLIATSVPFTPNVSELSQKSGISRPSLLRAIELLDRARILQILHKPNSGVGALTKPEKLYLGNPNLLLALAEENANAGTIRETFFSNQLKAVAQTNLAVKGDFLVNEKWVFEVGGRSKTSSQIKDIPNSFVAKDDIEIGVKNTIPLWMFGLLY